MVKSEMMLFNVLQQFCLYHHFGIILSRASEIVDFWPIWSGFVRKSSLKSAPESAEKYLDRTSLNNPSSKSKNISRFFHWRPRKILGF
jgi:hypothetical protein